MHIDDERKFMWIFVFAFSLYNACAGFGMCVALEM